jgi:lincosamide and streptogramin A transport system ATP-binding/permease protein
MSQITINDLTFSYDTTYDNIFEHVSFQIDTDWKLGFIGRNGRGKTTFLNLLLGKYEFQGTINSSVNFDYFPFEVKDPSTETLDIIKNTIAPFTQWEREMEQCLLDHAAEQEELKIDTTTKNDIAYKERIPVKETEETIIRPVMERYGILLDLYQAHDGYIIEELIEKELGKLQVDLSVLSRPFATLSFGERTKIMLAALFLKKNNFLLIDEPTNHLDMEGRETLANYLQTKKGFILVSHDRAFLDQCIDHVLSINRADIEVQKGNYTSWQQNKELQDNYELAKNEQLKKDITVLADAAKRAMGWSDQVEASKIGSHAADRGAIGHKAAKMMKRAKSIENRKLDAIEEKKGLLKNIEQADTLRMNLLPFPKKRFMEAENLNLFYGEREIASAIDFTLQEGDRIAIRGKNGSGKSTLFRLLLGDAIKFTGRFYVAQGLKVSYVSQDISHLAGNLKDFAVMNGLDEAIFKTVLRQLDFSRGQFEKEIQDFSGGQKKKVLLAKSLSEPANVFLWDEPLNFVDVFSRVQVEELILKYQPTMIFVEHDRLFADKIATKIVHLN